MKKYLGRWGHRKFYEKYYDVVKNYSIKRLIKCLRYEALKILFKDFFSSEDFMKMSNTDESLLSIKDTGDIEKFIQLAKNNFEWLDDI